MAKKLGPDSVSQSSKLRWRPPLCYSFLEPEKKLECSRDCRKLPRTIKGILLCALNVNVIFES